MKRAESDEHAIPRTPDAYHALPLHYANVNKELYPAQHNITIIGPSTSNSIPILAAKPFLRLIGCMQVNGLP